MQYVECLSPVSVWAFLTLLCNATVLILGSLRYSAYMSRLQAQERKKMAESGKAVGTGTNGSGSTYTTPSREMGTQTEGEEAALAATVDPGSSLVSLG